MTERVCQIERSVRTLAKPQAARGITLLEVLISIFVIAIGMLGIAALIPVGKFALVETAKADRSAACGRAAMCQVKARGLLNPVDPNDAARALWMWPNYLRPGTTAQDFTNNNYQAALVIVPSVSGPVTWALDPRLVGQPFVIDPLFVARARTDGLSAAQLGNGVIAADVVSKFPFTDRRDEAPNFSLPRLTMDVFGRDYNGNVLFLLPGFTDARKELVLDRIFRWSDDLSFSLDKLDADRRPQQDRLWTDGTVATANADPNQTPLVAETVGNYSWMMMVTPSPTETPFPPRLSTDHQRTYRVSIVVFFGRNLSFDPTSDKPNERSLEVLFTGGGYGGGDAVLFVPWDEIPKDVIPKLVPEDYLAVREGQWIMVYDAVYDPRLVIHPAWPYRRRIANWYRVVSANDIEQDVNDLDGDGDTTEWIRQITLAGPDWDQIKTISGAAGLAARAAVVDGIIGVYTKTIKLDRNTTRN